MQNWELLSNNQLKGWLCLNIVLLSTLDNTLIYYGFFKQMNTWGIMLLFTSLWRQRGDDAKK